MAKKEKQAEYFKLTTDGRGYPNWELVNRKTLFPGSSGLAYMYPMAWPEGVGPGKPHPFRLPDHVEKPRLAFGFDKEGREPRNFEQLDLMNVVSSDIKAVFEAIDPEGCEFYPCETYFHKTGEPGPERWLCTFKRLLFDAVDLENCEGVREAHFTTTPLKNVNYDWFPGYAIMALKPEVVGQAHCFRVNGLGLSMFCDRFAKDTLKAAGIKGAEFTSLNINKSRKK